MGDGRGVSVPRRKLETEIVLVERSRELDWDQPTFSCVKCVHLFTRLGFSAITLPIRGYCSAILPIRVALSRLAILINQSNARLSRSDVDWEIL